LFISLGSSFTAAFSLVFKDIKLQRFSGIRVRRAIHQISFHTLSLASLQLSPSLYSQMTGAWGFVSWNICGLRKLVRHQCVFSWLLGLQVIFLQESLQVTRTVNFPGFARFDVPAVVTPRRASGGLVTLISKSWLGNGVAEELVTESFLQIVRVSWSGIGVLLCNVYVPIHSEGCPLDIFTVIASKVSAVTSLYPSDATILGLFFAFPPLPLKTD
jgi:hypothetical protein